MTSHPMNSTPRGLASALETATALDASVGLLERVSRPLVQRPRLAAALRGSALGHPAHPLLTDVPLGLWISSTVLDLLGPAGSRPAATRLLGLGVLASVPTALTGLADWAASGSRVRRVGAAHAALNSAALGLYGASWLLRRRRRHAAGVALSLVAGGVVGASGYLGGHMAYVQRAPQG
ncbi:DUF2231 domain-containing protein [Cellulomonas edaphi]|uniref:DUF2231 domain-containing protein n=1 Tax=Cellulomonas edaphi TaxID=3053468 RepID=A0ABT7S7J5_9CELL|nr:DUF2231 domain-containing protein [Cellulomons edaphi]MDM7831598.1 DUF2231 domain-containing protein [Cellulomons edaphi]